MFSTLFFFFFRHLIQWRQFSVSLEPSVSARKGTSGRGFPFFPTRCGRSVPSQAASKEVQQRERMQAYIEESLAPSPHPYFIRNLDPLLASGTVQALLSS
jgi:hypothetical protein